MLSPTPTSGYCRLQEEVKYKSVTQPSWLPSQWNPTATGGHCPTSQLHRAAQHASAAHQDSTEQLTTKALLPYGEGASPEHLH